MCPQPSQRYQVTSAMSLSELAEASRTEINNYCRSEPYSEQYCLEIFHRALVQQDPDAWELLQEHCKPIVRVWMQKHARQDTACYHAPVEYYVERTFTRVWQSSICNTLKFDTLSAALRYLKLSLQGVVIDTLRVYPRHQYAPIPDSGSGPDAYSIGALAIEDNNDRERRLAYLLYYCNLKPKEIARNYSEDFSSTQEIYGLIRNIMERFMCNRDQSCRRLLYDQ